MTAPGRVVERRRYAYQTSAPLEEVVIARADGSQVRLLVKHCGDDREIEAYRVLASEQLGTPRCYASGRRWLAIEKVDGVELWQRGDVEAWEAVARWAAGLHRHFCGRPLVARLPCHDAPYYRRWVTHPRAATLTSSANAAIGRLSSLPRTLIHGELYPSNVLIAGDRVAVVDWETAALGPAAIDLAALITGWDANARARIVAAYGGMDSADLAAAELLLALKWLGRSDGFQAPREHRRDWLSEARRAAEVLTCAS